MSGDRLEICVVGAGPRGLSVLERLCANERTRASHPSVVVHLVDPFPPGPGRVWRTSQSGLLLMNTVASQVTVFTDASVEMDGAIEPGPSLYEWAKSEVVPGSPKQYDDPTRAEARELTPDSYPTRAFYGHYLEGAYRRVRASAPAHVTVCEHRTRAVALEDAGPRPGGPQTVTLADGSALTGLDAVVLAQGHVRARPTEQEQEWARVAAALGLTYVPPANPADLDLSAVRPGQTVLVRGLGLNFFDHMALLTRGRGGLFVRHGGRLVYRPSGREPHIRAGSRRGIPYHARGENEKGPHGRYLPRLLTPATIAALRGRAAAGEPVRFGTDLWPLIAKEVEGVYYETLLAARGQRRAAPGFVRSYLAAADEAAKRGLLDRLGVAEADRWDWDALSRPLGRRRFDDREAFRAWLLEHLDQDVREARAGNLSGPLKAALDVLRDLRNEIRLAVDHGGLEGDSYRDELQGWYTPLNAYLSIGPPASRIEELRALVEANVVEVIGPDLEVRIDTGGLPAFVAGSKAVEAEPVRATVLIEARLPEPDIRLTGDSLLRQLLTSGQAVPYRIEGARGGYETGGLAVTERPYRMVDALGRAHPRRFAYGVPTESVHWVTAAGIRPGVNSVTLGDSDAIAHAVLALAPARASTAALRQGADLARQGQR
ncbi:FAD/NAD(P)-binding domain-containing protein [Streptacidiphilus sp. P02-A3a]|uniref:FAD/NAD(P)-binding protein n=1 Tax=Streptacidiphilus sp. P02-A3a TaxID=2704468 RepID=UPI0015F87694|nr:FAD/NAD(P)-binding protein [Streptacidiphilus sp. P02-A3a]QMU71559.1 FAD/NAD(P)-binding protein [Streptacidiphilus sp. P02-A3a]